MPGTIGPLLPADEQMVHQIVDTFATVSQADLSWTEKVCAMAAARDGSLQVGFGIGKYPNRNVIDAYAGVSRGVGQWTVRASRRLATDPVTTAVGPIRYEIVEPLRSVRMVLEPNEVQPIAYDVTFTGVVPPFLEEREDWRTRSGFRHTANQIRYHQSGAAEGWVEVDGVRTEVGPATWVSTRDHSWGIRPDVGVPVLDLEPEERPDYVSVLAVWSPVVMERPDGSRYALHHYLRRVEVPDVYLDQRFQGGVEHPDGRKELFTGLRPEVRFDPTNRRFRGGRWVFTMADGSERAVAVEVVSDTGFHLGTGLYMGLDGVHHGSWRGELATEGEHFENCADPATARRIHQIRDCVVRVTDPVGGGTGIGNCQTVVLGAWPDLGLPTAEGSFV
jgi:hypothetical protein